jgi:hypothetical protein
MKAKILGLILVVGTLIVSCNNKSESSSLVSSSESSLTHSSEISSSSIDSTTPISNYQYDGVRTKAPYTAYNQDDTVIGVYPSMFSAIHHAAEKGLSTNKVYVKDSNDLVIFKRQAKNMYYMYDGDYYVGTNDSVSALNWADTKSRSYVLDGQGISFVKLGKELMEGSNEPPHYELISGGYNYLFSKQGVMQGGSWIKEGYGYASTYVRLSEATYHPSTDGDGWNAYIFINHSGKYNIDLGLIGNLMDGVVRWRLVRNCSHESHKPTGDNFKVLSSESVTTMTLNENGDYSGADDLFFEVIATVDGWTLNITNLRTNVVSTINEVHPDFHSESTPYFRFLLAASYCPVVGDVWNSRSGAYLKNVVFDHIKIARWNSSNDYSNATFEDFYPGESTMDYGYSQAADCASFEFGTYESAGNYKSGNSYSKGDKYLIFSTYYDGSNEQG